MAVDAAQFFELYFRELNRCGIPHVILHSYEELPGRMESDIDYAVLCADLPKIVPIQRALAAKHGWLVASVIRAKLASIYTVLFRADDISQFIQLDACSDYIENACSLMRDDELLDGRRPFGYFFVPKASVEFGYLLSKALVKNKPLEPHLPRLRELWRLDPDGAQQRFQSLLGGDAGTLDAWFSRPAAEWDRLLRPQLRAHRRFGLGRWLREGARAVQRIARPAGFHVALLGPDGAGKSTLITHLNPGTIPCVRRRRLFHFRPRVFEKRNDSPVSNPHGSPPRSVTASLAKTLYYFADQWAGYLFAVLPAKIRNELVIFDRSFEDMLIDPRRYRLRGASGLVRFLKKLLPRADVTFILDSEAQTIHARKPELPLEEIERQRRALARLANADPRCVLVRADKPPLEVAQTVIREIIIRLAAREERQAGLKTGASSRIETDSWRELFHAENRDGEVTAAFRVLRKAGEPFLMLPPQRRLGARALCLYPAQSRTARLAKQALRAALAVEAPLPAERTALKISPHDPFVKFLGEIAGRELPPVAILAGNSRAAGRRFVVLVFDKNGVPAAVVKAGVSADARHLIAREKSFLESVPPSTPGVPRMRASFHSDRIDALALDFISGDSPRDTRGLSKMLNAWLRDGLRITLGDFAIIKKLPSEIVSLLAARVVQAAICHGDFAPWNVKVSPSDGSWTALDWERGELCGVPGWDWFHFVIQPAVLVARQSAPELVQTAGAIFADAPFQAYAKTSGIAGIERPLLAAYLFHCLETNRQTEGREKLEALLRAMTRN